MKNRIKGDYTGTTYDDFLVLPGLPEDDGLTPDTVNLETDICGIKLGVPFFSAAMRSVTGKKLALAAGKGKMMGVAPRGLNPESQGEIVQYVKDHEIKPGDIESEENPITLQDNETLRDALKKNGEYGHSNIPVITKKADFVGMYTHSFEHEKMNPDTPITDVMKPFKNSGGSMVMDVGDNNMTDDEIKHILENKDYRFLPVLDNIGRLEKLVFIQKDDAYKVGAAIDTHEGWEKRADILVEAGADMIFIDTSDAYKDFAQEVIKGYKDSFTNGPPLCAGNIVTGGALKYLADAGADAVKVGMGPGSICSTNEVLGVGSPPMHALIEVSRGRDEYEDRYIPVVIDGGIENTGNINVAMTHADGLMGGKIFGCFQESAGKKLREDDRIVKVRIYGEASREAFETTGNMDRYTTPLDGDSITSFQGVSGAIDYKGRFKPGLEVYKKTLREALYHAGCADLKEYRENSSLMILSSRAKKVTKPHGIQLISE